MLGRLRACSVLALAAWLAGSAAAATVGIDVGTEWMRVALAKPGRALDMVLNRDAGRQTAAAVAISGLERTFGADAVALAARMPEAAFVGVGGLLGAAYDSEEAAEFRRQYPNRMERGSDGGVAFALGDTTVSVTELVAMQLQHARDLVRESEGEAVRDAVLAVPAFFGRAQRQALEDAAELAGLRVVALVNDGSAVALNYAMGRTFERAERHVFYDMGAGNTVATVAAFAPRKGGSGSARPLAVAAQAYAADRGLGGLALDFAVRDMLVAKFAASGAATAAELRASARAMARLLREARRVKTVLSANSEATAAVEGLLGADFRAPVTRAELERAAAPLEARIRAPVDRALAAANVTAAEVDSIVLVGGGSRVPLVQRALAAAFGAEKLSRSVNAEEACVMGAVFKAAARSSQFRVRDIRLRDALPYSVRATYAPELASPQTVLVSPDFGAAGARRSVRDVRSSDLAVEFSARASGSDDDWAALATARVAGVADAAARLQATPEVRVVVHTDDLGRFDVLKAEARFNVSNPALAEFAAAAAAWDAESAARDSESDAAPLRARPTPPPATVVETVALALDVTRHGPPRMSDAAREHARDLLRRMDADDAARVARSGAANQLESLVYHLRDIADDDDVAAVTTPAQRAALARALDAAADWLDANAELAPVAEIERQVAELRALEEPIAFRAAQLATRPARIAALRAAIAQAEDFAAQLRDQYAPKDLEPVARALEALEDSLDSTLAWLDALVAKQDALAPSDDPALTTDDLDAKARAVERSLAEVAAIAIKKASAESASAPQPETAAESELEPESEHTAPAAGHDEL